MPNSHEGRSPALWMVPVGIGINYLGITLAHALQLPLYLDAVGTILTGALCGYLPGILVGFFTNVLGSLSDPISIYYCTINILIACAAAWLAHRGLFSKVRTALAAVPVFALIGGGLGAVLTWLLAGFGFGSGISAPLAARFYAMGLPVFGAQLSADLLVDLADKLVSTAAVYAVLHLLPRRWSGRFPFWNGGGAASDGKKHYRVRSIQTEIAVMIIISGLVIGTLCTTVSFILYQKANREDYAKIATGIADLMTQEVPADRIDAYLAGDESSAEYQRIKARLIDLQTSFPYAQYFYVYRIAPDGCHVVFDLDTQTEQGNRLGDVVAFDPTFLPYLPDLLAGKDIAPIVSNDQYGWLLTVYRPLRDAGGTCTAYACVDISMDSIMKGEAIFLIQMVSVSCGALVLLLWAAISFANWKLAKPINQIAAAADDFAYESEDERTNACEAMTRLNIRNGNEVENLYLAICASMTDMARYISHIKEQTGVISTMQYNVITAFADMVENRDENTGDHVRRTAEYVEILARQLQADGRHRELLTDSYIQDLRASAPLHDIGKIRIPDRILNKPGRLTKEEFDEMKKHAAVGRLILEEATQNLGSFSYLNTAADMAGAHHERWDGTGYPNGLRGEEIPLCARIMAVADVLDALISRRSYKEAMTFDAAAAVIREESGTHFDPEIVQAFEASAASLKSAARHTD